MAEIDFTDGNVLTAAQLDSIQAGLMTTAHVQRDFGATGDGTTDDRVAIQSAITLMGSSGNGGVLFFPAGTYLIGTPGLVWPSNCQRSITLMGEGFGSTAALSRPTVLTRNGAYPVITATGTGTGDSTVVHGLNIKNLVLDGANTAAAIADLTAVANFRWEDVRLLNSTSYGINGKQIWNAIFDNMTVNNCGNATGPIPATVWNDRGVANSGTNTLQFIGCTFEGNAYDDINLTGSTQGTAGVVVAGCKLERNGAGVCIRDLAAGGTFIVGSYMFQGLNAAGSTVNLPCIVQNGGTRLGVAGCGFAGSSATNPTNLIQCITGGYLTVGVGCTFLGGVNHVRFESGFGSASVMGAQSDLFNTPTVVSDARTTKTGIVGSNGRLHCYDGIGTKTVAGAVSDASFQQAPLDGTIAYDSTNNQLYIRSGGVWKKTAAGAIT